MSILRDLSAAPDASAAAELLRTRNVLSAPGAMRKSLASRVAALPPSFDKDRAATAENFGLTHPIGGKVATAVLDLPGGSARLKYADGSSLVVVDRAQVLKLFLFVHFACRRG